MYKFIVLLFLSLFLSCYNAPNSFTITGNTDFEDGVKIYRSKVDGDSGALLYLDSTEVKNNSFKFTGNFEYPYMEFLLLEDGRSNIPVIIESGNIKVQLYKDSIYASSATGTVSNEDFELYALETKIFSKRITEINKIMNEAINAEDTAMQKTIIKEFDGIQEEVKEYEVNFIKDKTNSFIALIILEKFVDNNLLSIDSIISYYEKLTPRLKKSKVGQKINTFINEPPSVTIGRKAPNFTAPNSVGETVSLENTIKKVTLIDFWAAWCKPCRIENPNLVRLYNKYNQHGFEIVGVSLDKDYDNWIQAIKDDGLVWPQVSNLKFWKEPIAQQYNITSIPASFLLDENGVVIAANLKGDALEERISLLLGVSK